MGSKTKVFQMATSIESIIDSFITEHKLDTKLKEDLCDCFSQCLGAIGKHLLTEPIPETEHKVAKSQKVLKADKIDDPASVESLDELRNCTTGVLNEFCRNNSLKVGGNKKEIMDRVWRHLQGEGSDEDKSSRGKPKKDKKVAEKHICSGCNAKGAPCSVGGTEPHGDFWFCWRHIIDADSFLTTNKEVPVEAKKVKKMVSKMESDIKPKTPVKPPAKVITTAKVAKEPVKSKKVVELVSEESDDEEIAESDDEELVTDED